MPTSSTVLIFRSQIGENITTLLSNDAITDFDTASDDDLLSITLCKGKRTCTSYPISCFVFYSHLSSSFHAFNSSMDSYFLLKSVSEVLSILGWKDAMKGETLALEQNDT